MPRTRPATSRAIGPTVSKLGASGQTPTEEILPQVVLSPAVPQHAARGFLYSFPLHIVITRSQPMKPKRSTVHVW